MDKIKLSVQDLEALAEKLYETFDTVGWAETKYDIESGKTYGDRDVIIRLIQEAIKCGYNNAQKKRKGKKEVVKEAKK